MADARVSACPRGVFRDIIRDEERVGQGGDRFLSRGRVRSGLGGGHGHDVPDAD